MSGDKVAVSLSLLKDGRINITVEGGSVTLDESAMRELLTRANHQVGGEDPASDSSAIFVPVLEQFHVDDSNNPVSGTETRQDVGYDRFLDGLGHAAGAALRADQEELPGGTEVKKTT